MNQMNQFKSKVRKPRFFLYYIMLFALRLYFYPRCNVKVDKTNIRRMRKKKPFILVFNHGSKLDFCFSYLPLLTRINTMVAYYYFCNFKVGKLLHNLGGFPKYLFQPDISAIKNTMKVIKAKGAVGISPEGRLSPHGEMESVNPSTSKLLKKLGVDVYCNTIHGAYFALPKWSNTIRRGRVEIGYELLFSKEDLATLTEEEIQAQLEEALYYDEYAWNKEKRIKYKGKKFAEGLENILYICPHCQEYHTMTTAKDRIRCTSCGMQARLNPYYEFESTDDIPKNIKEWYNWQKEFEAKQMGRSFVLQSKVRLKLPDPKGKGFYEVGEGQAILSSQGMKYFGTVLGEQKEITYKIENIRAIVFGAGEDFEIYQDETLYYFVPENLQECARYSILAEIFYNQYLENENLQ